MNVSRRARWCVGAGGLVVLLVAAGAIYVGSAVSVEGTSPAERIASICRLADERPRGAGDAIADAAAGDADAAVRCAAMVALGRFVTPARRAVVLAGLDDPDPRVRAAAAETLGRYGDEQAADRLGALLQGAAEPGLRLAAARGLGVCEHPRAIVWLLETAEVQTDRKVRSRALEALLQKFEMRAIGAGPEDLRLWRSRLESIKSLPVVQRAFEDAGRPLVRHPEHVDDSH